MVRTLPTGRQIRDGTTQRNDLDVDTAGQAVIRKVIAGTNVTIDWTGVDQGTGDVTVNFTGGGGGSHGGATELAINDALGPLKIIAAESNGVLTEAQNFAINLTQTESNPTPTEATKLTISGSGFNDSNATPTEARQFTIRVWAAGCTDNDDSQTVPTRVNGANDNTRAAVKTNNALADLTNPVILTAPNFNVPTSGTFTSKLVRIWFNIPARTLSADTIVIDRQTTATGIVNLYTHAGTAAVDHNGGTFTADVSGIGLTDLATLDLLFSYTAAVVAVPETVLNIDACAVDLVGTL